MNIGAEKVPGDVARSCRGLICDILAFAGLLRSVRHMWPKRHAIAKSDVLLRPEIEVADDNADDQRDGENRPIDLEEFHAP
jgi:hypothetical protein